MVRLILIAVAIFLVIYLLSRCFNVNPQGNSGEGDMVGPRTASFLIAVIAVIAVLSLVSIMSRFGISLGSLLQKAVSLSPVISALLPF